MQLQTQNCHIIHKQMPEPSYLLIYSRFGDTINFTNCQFDHLLRLTIKPYRIQ